LDQGGQLDPPVSDVTFLDQGGQLDPPVSDVTFLDQSPCWLRTPQNCILAR
jgi:hypothetical protein